MPKYSIERLQTTQFGPFSHLDIEFSPQLNIITGDNGTGKTQLLKLLYTASKVLEADNNTPLTKNAVAHALADKLMGVFKPDALGRLASRIRGRSRAEVGVKFSGIGDPLRFNFASSARSEVKLDKLPKQGVPDTAVFLPARDLLSIYPGLVSLYDSREVSFDETWRDTALLLGRSALKGPRGDKANELLLPLLESLEGTVIEENGKFYVRMKTGTSSTGKVEAPLVSEGFRKLAMVVRLVQSGVLLEGGYLFWDEPEANLNPRTQKAVAQAIRTLALSGTQVFVATHSVFMLRELKMLIHDDDSGTMDTRYIGLTKSEAGDVEIGGVTADSGDTQEDIPAITALEAEADQAFRYLGL
ncbi:AAA family ATPase [Corynebacterium cystitidis]|uniref:AAA family ATPase n=1 Tax=Corynebacterium cystitidis TaxID=35757 RepID=UPI00211DAD56|nr:AAA family ATPase [Corynebacterium cystitidis]